MAEEKKNRSRVLKPGQSAELVDLCYTMISVGVQKSRIKQAIRQKYGEMSFRQMERYISKARQRMVEDTGLSVDEHRGEALAFYKRVKTLEDAPVQAKLKAQERIDKLLGLEQPQRVEHSGLMGMDVSEELATELSKVDRVTLSAYRSNRAGRTSSNGHVHNGNGKPKGS